MSAGEVCLSVALKPVCLFPFRTCEPCERNVHCAAHSSIFRCTFQWSFIAELRATTLFHSLSLSFCLPSLLHRRHWCTLLTKLPTYSTFILALSLVLSDCSSVWLCVSVHVLLSVFFFSTGKWLLNSVQTMISGWSEPDEYKQRAGICHSKT